MESSILVILGAVCFSVASFMMFSSRNKPIYQKMTHIFMSLLNGAVLYLATLSIPFEGACLLVAGIILAEFIVFEQQLFSSAVLLSASILFLLSTLGLISELFFLILPPKYVCNLDTFKGIKMLFSLTIVSIIALILRMNSTTPKIKKLITIEKSVEFLAIIIMFLSISTLIIHQIEGHELLKILSGFSFAATFSFLWGYIMYSSTLEKAKINEIVLKRQLNAHMTSHDIYGKYIEETGIFRHDFKALCQSLALSDSTEKVDGVQLVYDLKKRFDHIAVQKRLSNNYMVDAILKTAQMSFNEADIAFNAMFYISPALELDSVYLSRIVFSILDNAYMASIKLPEGKRFFKVETHKKSDWTTFSVSYASNGKDYEIDLSVEEGEDSVFWGINLSYNKIQEIIEDETGDRIFHLTIDEKTGTVNINIHFRHED